MTAFSSHSACPTTDNPAFVPGSYIVQPPTPIEAVHAASDRLQGALTLAAKLPGAVYMAVAVPLLAQLEAEAEAARVAHRATLGSPYVPAPDYPDFDTACEAQRQSTGYQQRKRKA